MAKILSFKMKLSAIYLPGRGLVFSPPPDFGSGSEPIDKIVVRLRVGRDADLLAARAEMKKWSDLWLAGLVARDVYVREELLEGNGGDGCIYVAASWTTPEAHVVAGALRNAGFVVKTPWNSRDEPEARVGETTIGRLPAVRTREAFALDAAALAESSAVVFVGWVWGGGHLPFAEACWAAGAGKWTLALPVEQATEDSRVATAFSFLDEVVLSIEQLIERLASRPDLVPKRKRFAIYVGDEEPGAPIEVYETLAAVTAAGEVQINDAPYERKCFDIMAVPFDAETWPDEKELRTWDCVGIGAPSKGVVLRKAAKG